nr:hypothetical protein [Turicimonas muris]
MQNEHRHFVTDRNALEAVSIALRCDSSKASRSASSGYLSGGVLSSLCFPVGAVAQVVSIVHL